MSVLDPPPAEVLRPWLASSVPFATLPTLQEPMTTDLTAPLQQNPLFQVFRRMRDGILLCDVAGQVLFFNTSLARDLGISRADLHRHCEQVFPDNEDLTLAIQCVLDTGESLSQELNTIVDKRPRSFAIDVVPLMLSAEHPEALSGCVVIFHDLTNIRQTEKMRRDFVANVSHELRTPLSAIKGYAETLLDGALQDEAVAKDFVDVIFKHSLRLTSLVQDLLDLSKLETTEHSLELDPIDLNPLLNRTKHMVEDAAEKKHIRLSLQIQEPLACVMGHSNSIEQVLTNLLDNAIKYTPEGGKVTLIARPVTRDSEASVQVSIEDTGLGIDPKHVPRLFERFYRVDKARSRDMGGTGLGLSIVKHIVQIHGGDIWVDSEPNVGSTFHFTLRCA